LTILFSFIVFKISYFAYLFRNLGIPSFTVFLAVHFEVGKEFCKTLYHFIAILSFFIFVVTLKLYKLRFQIIWFSEKVDFEIGTLWFIRCISNHLWIKVSSINNCNQIMKLKFVLLLFLINFDNKIVWENLSNLLELKLFIVLYLLHIIQVTIRIWLGARSHLRHGIKRTLWIAFLCLFLFSLVAAAWSMIFVVSSAFVWK